PPGAAGPAVRAGLRRSSRRWTWAFLGSFGMGEDGFSSCSGLERVRSPGRPEFLGRDGGRPGAKSLAEVAVTHRLSGGADQGDGVAERGRLLHLAVLGVRAAQMHGQ